MGAWGHGYFDDDAAFDFMDALEESDDPKGVIRDAFEGAVESDYLETDEGNAVVVAATYVDRQVNGTLFSGAGGDDPLPVDTFPDRHPDAHLRDLKPLAVQALHVLLGESSELKELWEEDGEPGAWRAGIEQLIARLSR
jgi:hypothetical protein